MSTRVELRRICKCCSHHCAARNVQPRQFNCCLCSVASLDGAPQSAASPAPTLLHAPSQLKEENEPLGASPQSSECRVCCVSSVKTSSLLQSGAGVHPLPYSYLLFQLVTSITVLVRSSQHERRASPAKRGEEKLSLSLMPKYFITSANSSPLPFFTFSRSHRGTARYGLTVQGMILS